MKTTDPKTITQDQIRALRKKGQAQEAKNLLAQWHGWKRAEAKKLSRRVHNEYQFNKRREK